MKDDKDLEALQKELTAGREKIIKILNITFDEFDLSTRIAAPYMGVSHQTIYRWLSGDVLVPMEQQESVSEFIILVTQTLWMQWKKIVVEWPSQQLDDLVKQALYTRPALKILDDFTLTTEEKIKELVRLSLKTGRR